MGAGIGIAEGLNAGVRNFAIIDNVQRQKEEQDMRLADWHYNNDPIGKVSDVVEKLGVDDGTKQQVYGYMEARGFKPGSTFTRKHLKEMEPILNSDKSLELMVTGGRIKKMEAEVNLMNDADPNKKAALLKIQEAKDALDPEAFKRGIEKRKVAALEKTASAKDTAKTWQQKAVEEGWTAKQIADEEARIKGKDADAQAAAAAREETKYRARQEERDKKAEDAAKKAEEKKVADEVKASEKKKNDAYGAVRKQFDTWRTKNPGEEPPPDLVEGWNTTLENAGLPPMGTRDQNMVRDWGLFTTKAGTEKRVALPQIKPTTQSASPRYKEGTILSNDKGEKVKLVGGKWIKM